MDANCNKSQARDANRIQTLLALCARPESTKTQMQLLSRHLATFSSWDRLVNEAEYRSMGPLLYHHLEVIDTPVPKNVRRILKTLFLRHRQANAVRMEYLFNVLNLFKKTGIEVLVLKGAALCQLIYSDPGLRPMGDLDLLLRKTDLSAAKTILLENGFSQSPPIVTPFGEHYHLEPLVAARDGLTISVELHHALFPPKFSRGNLDFTNAAPSAVSFNAGGMTAKTLGVADMLWHLYRHGFSSPLNQDSFRLISTADIIGLVEKNIDRVDWRVVFSKYPQLKIVLPLFHFLSPWSEKVIDRLSMEIQKPPRGVGQPFTGWPSQPLLRIKSAPRFDFIHDTLWPPEWWFRLYYAPDGKFAYWWCRFARHPKLLLKRAWIVWPFFLKRHLPCFIPFLEDRP